MNTDFQRNGSPFHPKEKAAPLFSWRSASPWVPRGLNSRADGRRRAAKRRRGPPEGFASGYPDPQRASMELAQAPLRPRRLCPPHATRAARHRRPPPRRRSAGPGPRPGAPGPPRRSSRASSASCSAPPIPRSARRASPGPSPPTSRRPSSRTPASSGSSCWTAWRRT